MRKVQTAALTAASLLVFGGYYSLSIAQAVACWFSAATTAWAMLLTWYLAR